MKPLILFESSHGVTIPSELILVRLVLYLPPRMSNKQRKLIRLAILTDLRGKHYSLQKKYTRRKRFAANQNLVAGALCAAFIL